MASCTPALLETIADRATVCRCSLHARQLRQARLHTHAAASTSEASTALPSPGTPELVMPRDIQRQQPQQQQQQQQQQAQPSGRDIESSALRMAVQWTKEHPEGLKVWLLFSWQLASQHAPASLQRFHSEVAVRQHPRHHLHTRLGTACTAGWTLQASFAARCKPSAL